VFFEVWQADLKAVPKSPTWLLSIARFKALNWERLRQARRRGWAIRISSICTSAFRYLDPSDDARPRCAESNRRLLAIS
jgi:hypothetical protein